MVTMGMENNGWQIWSWNDKVCGNISKDADVPSTSYVNILVQAKFSGKRVHGSYQKSPRSLKYDNFKKASLPTLVLLCGTTWKYLSMAFICLWCFVWIIL